MTINLYTTTNNNNNIYFICKAQFKYKTNSFHSFSLRGSVTNSHMIVNNINKLLLHM